MNIKKQIILRGLLGIPLGIAIGYLITIFISISLGKGYYSACSPLLIEQFGNEINAVIFQCLLCGILGVGFGASSVIWEIEEWSIAKQTGIYFLITSLLMLPIAYANHWMEHTFKGFLFYSLIFILIFIFMWLLQYFIYKSKITKLNEKISNINNNH